MKHSRLLFRLFAASGIVFLALLLVGCYLNCSDSVSILASLASPNFWFPFLLIGGIVLLTIGILGTGRQHVKKHKNLFTVLAALLVPLFAFVSMFVALTMAMVYAPMFPMRSEITRVTIVDTSPLVLSLDVKALTSRDSRIEGAIVLDSSDVIVAEIYEREYVVSKNWRGLAMAVLPSGSEIKLDLDFNCPLPSGDYVIRLTGGMHDNHGSAPFTIP